MYNRPQNQALTPYPACLQQGLLIFRSLWESIPSQIICERILSASQSMQVQPWGSCRVGMGGGCALTCHPFMGILGDPARAILVSGIHFQIGIYLESLQGLSNITMPGLSFSPHGNRLSCRVVTKCYFKTPYRWS